MKNKQKSLKTVGIICSGVQIAISVGCLIYNIINHENVIIWLLFLCSGLLLLCSNLFRDNQGEK